MKICLECGRACVGKPILMSDDDDPIDLEVLSDCCLAEYEEVPSDYIDDLLESNGWAECFSMEDSDNMSDLDRLIIKAQLDEV